MEDHLFLVAYDIADPKRLREIFKLMKGYGEWLQLSIFQCRLSDRRRAELIGAIEERIKHARDHVLVIDIGPADKVDPRVTSLGKPFQVLERGSMVV